MTKHAWMVAMVAVAAMSAIGCAGSAHVVRRGSFSGELALTGGRHARMDAAQMAMLEHCGGRARVVSGDEALSIAATDPGIAKTAGEIVQVDGERLHYVCITLASSAR
jgi:hypothetical protein